MKHSFNQKLLNSKHWNGNGYGKISLPQFNINNAFLNEYHFSGDEKVLDIGCGDGKTSAKIATKVPHGEVLGIDASKSMIDVANHEIKSSNLRFQFLNAQELNFTEQFNLATCFFCMQWIPDKEDTFKRIYTSLKPNGIFLMIVPLPHPYLPNIRQKLITKPCWRKYFNNYTDPLIHINDFCYVSYAQKAGFIISSYRVDQTPVTFTNYNSFFEFMKQMTPHISCLPSKEEKNLFIHDLLEQYLKIYPLAADGSCQLNFDLVKFCSYRPKN